MSAALTRDGDRVVATAPAKVNLRLRVLARETSGFHQLETVFCALDLADHIEIERGHAGIALEVEGAELGPLEDNLVFLAARDFCNAAGVDPALRIRLRKEVPAGAGLGGGSSDAAATLLALNTLHDEPLPPQTLMQLGARLGSDVPFFLCGSPLALAWGRGERLLPLAALPPAPVLVVAPSFGISTPDAYRNLDRYTDEQPAALESYTLHPSAFTEWDQVAALAVNDFEAPTFAQFPTLARIKAALVGADATLALLSGSGSALFAVFPDRATLATAKSLLQREFPDARLIETTTAH